MVRSAAHLQTRPNSMRPAHGFRPIVPLEAVGDRAQEPHEANLFDIGSKYGDVVPTSEVVEYLDNL